MIILTRQACTRPPPCFTSLQIFSVSSLQASKSIGSARMSTAACTKQPTCHTHVKGKQCDSDPQPNVGRGREEREGGSAGFDKLLKCCVVLDNVPLDRGKSTFVLTPLFQTKSGCTAGHLPARVTYCSQRCDQEGLEPKVILSTSIEGEALETACCCHDPCKTSLRLKGAAYGQIRLTRHAVRSCRAFSKDKWDPMRPMLRALYQNLHREDCIRK